MIKVGASEAGFKAIRELGVAGIRTNATLIFSTARPGTRPAAAQLF